MRMTVKYFIIWFIVSLIIYFTYISLMADSLGINRSFQSSDIIEASFIGGLSSLILTGITIITLRIFKK